MVFCRVSALLLASPIFGNSTPAQIRVMICGVVTMCITPAVQSTFGPVPADMLQLVSIGLYQILIGLLIGACTQLLLLGVQMGGAFLDLNIGLGSAQLLNPVMMSSTTIFGQFKFMLSLVILLLLNGHHMMFAALVRSFDLAGGSGHVAWIELQTNLMTFVGQICLLALQIAAPAAGVCIIIDLAAGLVSRAVPQMQVYMVTMPSKILAGVVALSVALPILVAAIQFGVERSFTVADRLVRSTRGVSVAGE